MQRMHLTSLAVYAGLLLRLQLESMVDFPNSRLIYIFDLDNPSSVYISRLMEGTAIFLAASTGDSIPTGALQVESTAETSLVHHFINQCSLRQLTRQAQFHIQIRHQVLNLGHWCKYHGHRQKRKTGFRRVLQNIQMTLPSHLPKWSKIRSALQNSRLRRQCIPLRRSRWLQPTLSERRRRWEQWLWRQRWIAWLWDGVASEWRKNKNKSIQRMHQASLKDGPRYWPTWM